STAASATSTAPTCSTRSFRAWRWADGSTAWCRIPATGARRTTSSRRASCSRQTGRAVKPSSCSTRSGSTDRTRTRTTAPSTTHLPFLVSMTSCSRSTSTCGGEPMHRPYKQWFLILPALTVGGIAPAYAEDAKAVAAVNEEPALSLDPTTPQVATLPGGVTPAYGRRSQSEGEWRFDFHGLLLAPLPNGIG